MPANKNNNKSIIPNDSILRKIYFIREQKVMLDFDLAVLYEVATKRLNEQVKRNLEWQTMRSQFAATSSQDINLDVSLNMRSHSATASQKKRNIATTPYAFTEQGVAMLSGVINSIKAIAMNIAIMRAFVAIRKIIINNNSIANKLQLLNERVDGHDAQLNSIYEAIENLLDDKIDKEFEKEKWLSRKRIGFKSDK